MTYELKGVIIYFGLLALHAALFATVGDPVASLAPASLCGAAVVFFSLRSEQPILKGSRAMLLKLYLFIAALVIGTLIWFLVAPETLSFKGRLVRATMVDMSAALLASAAIVRPIRLRQQQRLATER